MLDEFVPEWITSEKERRKAGGLLKKTGRHIYVYMHKCAFLFNHVLSWMKLSVICFFVNIFGINFQKCGLKRKYICSSLCLTF